MDLTIDRLCTLEDYYALPDERRTELIRGYWIVDPVYERILVYYFGETDEPHDPVTIYGINDRVRVNIYEDLEIDFSQINE